MCNGLALRNDDSPPNSANSSNEVAALELEASSDKRPLAFARHELHESFARSHRAWQLQSPDTCGEVVLALEFGHNLCGSNHEQTGSMTLQPGTRTLVDIMPMLHCAQAQLREWPDDSSSLLSLWEAKTLAARPRQDEINQVGDVSHMRSGCTQ